MVSYSEIKTFRELCHYGAKLVSDETNFGKEWLYTMKFLQSYDGYLSQGKFLYEMVGDKRWIARLILKYNKLGFYTVISQPGIMRNDRVYKSHWHGMVYKYNKKRKYPSDEYQKDIILKDAKYMLGQRAFVSGYMMNDMAQKIYYELKDNEDLIVRLSSKEEPLAEEYEIITITFKDGRPMFEEVKESEKLLKKLKLDNKCFDYDENFKKLPDISETYFPYRGYHPNVFSFDFRKELPKFDQKLFEDNAIVRFSVMDKRWNDNSTLWTELMKAINKFTNMKE